MSDRPIHYMHSVRVGAVCGAAAGRGNSVTLATNASFQFVDCSACGDAILASASGFVACTLREREPVFSFTGDKR